MTGLLVLTAYESRKANAGSLQLSLPSRNAGLSGRFTYGWDRRYFTEFNFGYNGSERFHKSHRWGFFPSAGAAWVMSNEPWFKSLKKTVDNLKFRVSYGLVGNDKIGNENNRFYYLSEMNMNSSANQAFFGDRRQVNYKGIDVTRYANEAITWEKSYKTNYAVELGLFDNFDLIAEYFTERRKDIFMTRADVPETMGLQAGISANIGEARAHGVDLQAEYQKVWNKDFWTSARANFTWSTGKYDVYEEPTYPEKYRQHAGYSIKQTWGYIAERLFIDDEEAANSLTRLLSVLLTEAVTSSIPMSMVTARSQPLIWFQSVILPLLRSSMDSVFHSVTKGLTFPCSSKALDESRSGLMRQVPTAPNITGTVPLRS